MKLEVDTLGLPTAGLPLLRDLIHERTGLYYDDSRCDILCDRLGRVVIDRGFRSYLDLYYLLKYDDVPADWSRIMDALAVPETYFWREADQIRAVVCRVIPGLVAASRGAPVRIWSAPCASGEEPLTIAMMLEEAGWFDRASIEIHASDASAAAIEKARAGVYRDRSFRALPAEFREKYFVAMDGGYQAVPTLRRRITSFSVMNLMEADATAAIVSTSPVIFCRNAFIYFSADGVRRVVANFAGRMPRPGYLCVGASESLLHVTTAFTLEEIDGAFVYVTR